MFISISKFMATGVAFHESPQRAREVADEVAADGIRTLQEGR